MIRKMNENDIKEVQLIDKVCFKRSYTRRTEILKAFLIDNASLVYEDKGKVVGYIFNHILGDFAWFGTLGVDPNYRGSNIGKELVNKTIDMFRNEFNIKTIGIVTMPESCYNIGFYIKRGFTPRELALRLKRNLNSKTEISNINEKFKIEFIDGENEEQYEKIISNAKKISSSLYEGLDMSSEIDIAYKSKTGTSFIIYENNKVIGFAILRFKSVFDEEDNSVHIRLICIKNTVSPYIEILDAVLNEIYKYSYDGGFSNVFIDVNTLNANICSHLLKNHYFQVDKSSVTLLIGNENFYSEINGLMLFRTVT